MHACIGHRRFASTRLEPKAKGNEMPGVAGEPGVAHYTPSVPWVAELAEMVDFKELSCTVRGTALTEI